MAEAAHVFGMIGSSGQVYPAAGLSHIARKSGARVLEMNLESTFGRFHSGLYGKASETVPEWVDKMLTAYA